MGKWLISFLSGLFIIAGGCKHPGLVAGKDSTDAVYAGGGAGNAVDCTDKHVQDSLLKRYVDNGAEKLPYYYNNPAWGSYFDSVIAICPDIAAAWQLKAIPFLKNGEYGKAFALNDRAAELDPRQFMAYRGFLKCIFTKDYDGAILDFEKAQQITPDGFEMDHTYSFYEGLCNLELGKYPEAVENFNRDIFIQTGGDTAKAVHFNTLLYAGILNYEMKKDGRAKEWLLKCLGIYKELPEANYYLALVYEREGNAGLKKKYLEIAAESIRGRYTLNEDNRFYTYYPHQITLYEVEKELSKR